MTDFVDLKPPREDELECEMVEPGVVVKNRIKHVLRPGGRKNRNAMLVLFVGGSFVLFLLWLFFGSGSAEASNNARATRNAGALWADDGSDAPASLVSAPLAAAILAPPPRESPLPEGDAPIGDYGNSNVYSGNPPNGLASAPAQQGGVRAEAADSAVTPRKTVFAFNPKGGFVHRFRDARGSEKLGQAYAHAHEEDSGAAAQTPPEPPGSGSLLPQGMRIPMQLLDPVSTGVKSRARIRVMADAFDHAGRLTVPAGTEGELPFAGVEVPGGRLVLNADEKGILRIGGVELALVGSIRDKDDGLVGLKGKVKKTGGRSVLGRTVGAVGRAASGVVARTGVPVYEVDSALGSAGGDMVYGTTRHVVVDRDTQFTFVVGQQNPKGPR